ncbi:MAG: sulfurtransferase TusA family protein [Sphaerochaetaceae bacterium]|jgi:TusA-related sulfurtransferase
MQETLETRNLKEIDARGLPCPQPVIMTKRVTDTGLKELVVLVNHRAALENVTRYAAHSGYAVESIETSPGEYRLVLTHE